MSKTIFNKDGSVSIVGLTKLEYDILESCLDHCKDAMIWYDDECIATDGERFIWEIDDKEYFDTLKSMTL